MSKANPYINQYRKGAVTSASPLQLIIMLYDGSIRFMEAGKGAMLAKDLFEQNDKIQKAQKIISELISCLDMDKGGEIAENLLSLYTWVYNRLVEANIQDQPSYIDECVETMRQLRSSWVKLEEQSHHAVVENVELSPVRSVA